MLDFMSMPSFRTFKQNEKKRKRWDVRPILKRKINEQTPEFPKISHENAEIMVMANIHKKSLEKLAVVSPVYTRIYIYRKCRAQL